MNALASTSPVAPTALPLPSNAGTPSVPGAAQDGAREHEFARCLDRARDGGRPRDEAAAPSAREHAAAGAKERSTRDASAKSRDGATKAADANSTDAADAAAPVDRQSAAAGEDTPVIAASDGQADATGSEEPVHDLSLLLPGWTPPSAAPMASAAVGSTSISIATAAGDDAAGIAADAEGLPALSAATASTASARSMAAGADASHASPAASAPLPPQAAPAAQANARGGEAAAAALNATPGAAAVAGEHKTAVSEAQPTLPNSASPVAVAAAGSLATPPLKANEALLATASATVHAPIDTPAFAPALATQLRWWAHGGVQQAQLTLNPAEMGPVAVRIVLDGREARIDFSADVAATRGAIEAALPVLAATLDDSGLKLTGGGVHDGAAGRQPDWSARGVTHRTGEAQVLRDDAGLGGSAAARPAGGRGLVDLVA